MSLHARCIIAETKSVNSEMARRGLGKEVPRERTLLQFKAQF